MKAKHLLLLLLLSGNLGCDSKHSFSVQNCYGEEISVVIDLGAVSDLDEGLLDLVEQNMVSFSLPYPEIKKIGFIKASAIRSGLPFEKVTIVRLGDTTIINHGEDIWSKMDTDPFGMVSPPYALCL